MSNLDLWNKYKAVPANALKDFDNGNFKGTDINTIWRMKCLTEQFGMCGIGWYYDIININHEKVEEADTIMTFAEIKLYIKVDGEWSKAITGVGGNKMLTKTKPKADGTGGYYKASDEATKMAVTDAIGNACRNLGIGADVYWANDKTKYTDNTTPQTTKTSTINPTNQTTPQTTEKPQNNGLKCEQCNTEVTEKVAKFSKDKYGKVLCYAHQRSPQPAIVEIEPQRDDDLPWD